MRNSYNKGYNKATQKWLQQEYEIQPHYLIEQVVCVIPQHVNDPLCAIEEIDKLDSLNKRYQSVAQAYHKAPKCFCIWLLKVREMPSPEAKLKPTTSTQEKDWQLPS